MSSNSKNYVVLLEKKKENEYSDQPNDSESSKNTNVNNIAII